MLIFICVLLVNELQRVVICRSRGLNSEDIIKIVYLFTGLNAKKTKKASHILDYV